MGGDVLDVGQQYPDVLPRDEPQHEGVKHGGSRDGAVEQQIIASLLSWGRNNQIILDTIVHPFHCPHTIQVCRLSKTLVRTCMVLM